MLMKASLIEWASHWVPAVAQKRFSEALAYELKDWKEPLPETVFCKHCPFAEHVHYESDGKKIAPGCTGFEAAG